MIDGVRKKLNRLLRSSGKVVETAQPIHGASRNVDEVVISKSVFDELVAALRKVGSRGVGV